MAGYLTIETVRNEIQDRHPGDNSIDQDLMFSDEEIAFAMKRAARAYNALAPRNVDVVDESCLPDEDNNIFLKATISQLYGSAMHKLMRNVMTWSTGGTTVDFEKTRLENFGVIKRIIDAEWKEEALQRKISINRDAAWGYM